MAFEYNAFGIDPLLTDPDNGDFSLRPESPAIGSGCQTFIEQRFVDETHYVKSNSINVLIRETQEFSGSIFENTLWDADTIRIIGDVTIEEHATLNIAAGTIIEFQDHFKFEVKGSIVAIGTANQLITFTYYDPHAFSIEDNPSGSWAGILFNNTQASNLSKFSYCRFEYSKGLDDNQIGGVFYLYNFSNLTIENSIFQYNLGFYGGAIGLNYFSNPHIVNNLFINNFALQGGSVLYSTYSYPVLANNTIIENNVINVEVSYPTATFQTYMSKPKILNNIIWDNWTNYYTNFQLLNCKPYYVFNNIVMDGYEGESNLDLNPQFSPSTIFQPEEDSPCINAGTISCYGINFPVLDLLGNTRIIDSAIDLGVTEFQEVSSQFNDEIPSSINTMKCYPNPFYQTLNRGNLIVELEKFDEVITSISIFDLRGRNIKRITIAEQNQSNIYNWNINDNSGLILSSGVYLIQAKSNINNFYQSKILYLK